MGSTVLARLYPCHLPGTPMLFGYICPQNARGGRTNDKAAQRAALDNYCNSNGFTLYTIFVESAEFPSISIPWHERPAGRQLARQLKEGSHVIASAASIFTTVTDLLSVVRDFNERGIVLHFSGFKLKNGLEIPLSTHGEASEALLIALLAMASLTANNRGEAVSEGMREKKRQGKKHCRHAGYGFLWRCGKREVHLKEQAVMAKIVEWREKGFSWYGIAAHLLHHRILTADRREWSTSRVRRAYISEMKRRAEGG